MTYEVENKAGNISVVYRATSIPDVLDLVAAAKGVPVLDGEKRTAAVATLESMGYLWEGGILWRPPVAEAPAQPLPEIEKPEDPHAELRKTWAPWQRWQAAGKFGGVWHDIICGPPSWRADEIYQRHPDDLTPPAVEKPWYPDDSGEWVEVPDDCMECPVDGEFLVGVLQKKERDAKKFVPMIAKAGLLNWAQPVGDCDRTVAYKVVAP